METVRISIRHQSQTCAGINRRICVICWIVCLFLMYTPRIACAQDSIPLPTPPSTDTPPPPFKPNPKKAWIASAIFPGLGQIYNRQYWKLPIVCGGFAGCAYAISWNNRTLQDYKNAYFSIVKDAEADPLAANPDSWSQNWIVFVPGSADPASYLKNTTFHNNLKRNKDYFRRYRDLSIIISIAIYGLVIADAYVDAQMFDFDVSTDLSFQVTPLYMPETLYYARSYGINICMTF